MSVAAEVVLLLLTRSAERFLRNFAIPILAIGEVDGLMLSCEGTLLKKEAMREGKREAVTRVPRRTRLFMYYCTTPSSVLVLPQSEGDDSLGSSAFSKSQWPTATDHMAPQQPPVPFSSLPGLRPRTAGLSRPDDIKQFAEKTAEIPLRQAGNQTVCREVNTVPMVQPYDVDPQLLSPRLLFLRTLGKIVGGIPPLGLAGVSIPENSKKGR